jgi:glycosyltransferase involved in cell wall biosynthesis
MSVQAKKLVARLSSEEITVELIPTNPAPPGALNFLNRIPVLRTVFRELQFLMSLTRIMRNPGVVHHFSASYLFFFLHSAPVLLLGQWPGVKVVLNYRGGQAADFLRTWSWAALPCIRQASEIAVPSEFLQRVFEEYGLASSLLPNLADTELFAFVERDQFSPRLFVSRNLEPMYDVESVLRAFKIVQSRISEAVLGIAGDGSEASRLRVLTGELNLRGVIFHGAVPHDELPSLYGQYDIYVNASRVDNFPGALVEAACSGLPIVTTCAGGIPDMVRHEENGMLCDVGDVEALARNVLDIIQRPEIGRELAQNARTWAGQFSWQNIFPKLMQCYGLEVEAEHSALPPGEVLVH